MEASITVEGQLLLIPKNETELYALHRWYLDNKENINTENLVILSVGTEPNEPDSEPKTLCDTCYLRRCKKCPEGYADSEDGVTECRYYAKDE